MAFWHPLDLGCALAVLTLALVRDCPGGRQKHRRSGMNGHPISGYQIRQDDDAEEILSHPAVNIPSTFPVFKVFFHRYFDTNIRNKSSQ
jgi:hypothetical protein